jgi:hypothetical protein
MRSTIAPTTIQLPRIELYEHSARPTQEAIATHLAILNAAFNAPVRPNDPISLDVIALRCDTADACFQWFIGNHVAIERDRKTGIYHEF